MPETMEIQVTQSWQIFRDHTMIDGELFTFKNAGPSEIQIFETAGGTPPDLDNGVPYPKHGAGWGELQGASFYVRCNLINGAQLFFQRFIPFVPAAPTPQIPESEPEQVTP